jgi:hypothetical protein
MLMPSMVLGQWSCCSEQTWAEKEKSEKATWGHLNYGQRSHLGTSMPSALMPEIPLISDSLFCIVRGPFPLAPARGGISG